MGIPIKDGTFEIQGMFDFRLFFINSLTFFCLANAGFKQSVCIDWVAFFLLQKCLILRKLRSENLFVGWNVQRFNKFSKWEN